MVAPINYMGVYGQQSASPFMEGLQSGALAREAIDAGVAERNAAELKKQYAIDLQSNLAKPSAKGFAELALKYPQQREAFKQAWETLSKDQQDNEFLVGSQAYNAISSGNVNVAKDLITKQIVAAENAGQSADKFKAMLTTLDSDPKIVQSQLGLILSSVDPTKWSGIAKESRESTAFPLLQKKLMAELSKAGSEAQKANIEAKYANQFATLELEQKAANLGLTKQQTNKVISENKKLGTEVAKSVMELEALQESGGLDPTKKFEQEEKIRKEFLSRNKIYDELGLTFNNINASSKAGSGAGDVALITGFMKMLDPGSVVRETEFATARDTAGLYSSLQGYLNKAKSGKFLTEGQRKEFVSLAQSYYDSAKQKSEKDKKALGAVVKNYKLNPDNVFGPEETVPAGNVVTVQGKTYTKPSNFTDAQWNAYKQQMGAQ